MPVSQTRLIARLSTKAGEHVRIADGPSLHERECRLGPRFDTGLSLHQFEVVLCVRVESPEHINVEEAKALLWYIQNSLWPPSGSALRQSRCNRRCC